MNLPVTIKTKPWNQPNLPVYSLSTYSPESHKINMNICTYISCISMKPKLYSIAVYKNTLTHNNTINTEDFLLQLLSMQNLNIVKKLGKTSGLKQSNKLSKIHLNQTSIQQLSYLDNIVSYIHLKKIKFIPIQGDHDILIAQALSYKNFLDPSQILYTYDLKANNIIS